ncbi:formylglycine-generating enzyme family protein [Myxococcota bacterium]|nr:formylglycine-generating enzyme family protein [Myxococcota bacterium]
MRPPRRDPRESPSAPPGEAATPPARGLEGALGAAWAELWHPRPGGARLDRAAGSLGEADALDVEGRTRAERAELRALLARRVRAARVRRALGSGAGLIALGSAILLGPRIPEAWRALDRQRLERWRSRLDEAPLRIWARIATDPSLAPVRLDLGAPVPLGPRVAAIAEPDVAAAPVPPVPPVPRDEGAASPGETGDGAEAPPDTPPSSAEASAEPVAAPAAPAPRGGAGEGARPRASRAGYGIAWPGGLTDGQVMAGAEPGHPAGGERWVRVPGGPYRMGTSGIEGEPHERPRHRVEVGAFEVDTFETTVGAFAAWCLRDRASCAWTPESTADPAPDRPVTGVTWREAALFCAARGGRLPTEAEWEKAARWQEGGGERRYPWGDRPPDCSFARFSGCEAGGPRSVTDPRAAAGASALGVRDMAGNASEWVADPYAAYPGGRAEANPRPDLGRLRVVRGGSFGGDAADLRSSDRDAHPEGERDLYVGFRCARDAREGGS